MHATVPDYVDAFHVIWKKLNSLFGSSGFRGHIQACGTYYVGVKYYEKKNKSEFMQTEL